MASAAKSAKAGDEGEDAEVAEAASTAKPRKSRGALPMILGSALLSAAIASGVTWFLAPKHGAAAKPAAQDAAPAAAADGDAAQAAAATGPQQPALYLDLTPAFVVNLADEDAMRFLQVEVQLMARDPKVIDAAKDHMPRIRNALMLLFSQQHAHDLATRPAKEALQKQALDEVQQALQQENAPSAVEAVYFTSLVMQ